MRQTVATRTEDALLFACARTQIDRGASEISPELFDRGIDWSYVTTRAIHHRVVPLVYQALRQEFADRVPEATMAELQHVHGVVVRKNLLLLSKLVRLTALLEQTGIAAIPFKGPALAVLAYGNFGLRQFGDLDILVHPNDFRKTRDLLLAGGHRLASEQAWECSLIDPADGVLVDLHEAITPANFPVPFDFHTLQRRTRPLPVAGKTIRTFCPEDMLIVLCVQLAKDGWGTNVLRLIKICDIAELLRIHPEIDWEQVRDQAARLRCIHIVSFALEFSRELLGAPVPALPFRPIARRNYVALAGHIRDKLVHQQAPGYAGVIGSNKRFHFRVRERWSDKLHPYVETARTTIRPSARDREFLRLPASFESLYYAVRPIRVLRDLWRRRRDPGGAP